MKLFALFLLISLSASGQAKAEEPISLCPAVQDSANTPANFQNVKGLRPGLDGWLFADRDVKVPSTITADTLVQFTRFAKALNARGTQLALTLIPNRLLLSTAHWPAQSNSTMLFSALRASYGRKITQLRGTGAIVPDLLTPLEQAPDELFMKRDHHWLPAGAEVMAKLMAVRLGQLRTLQSLPMHSYMTSLQNPKTYTGSYAKFANSACDLNLPTEELVTPITQRSDSIGLVDNEMPEIALVGTSFSLDKFNYVGALMQALGHEIEPHAVDAGGIDDAILAFTSSNQFAAHKYRLLIWESPDIYSFNVPNMWRQLVPAAQGACTDARALARNTAPIQNGILLINLQKSAARPRRDFIVLDISDPTLVKFDLLFTYMGGEQETFNMDRSTRDKNSGRFFIELGSPSAHPLTSVTFMPATPATGTVAARLCRGQ